MKLSQIQKGTRYVRRVTLFYSGLRPQQLAQIPEFAEDKPKEPHFVVGIRPLTGGEEAQVLESAQSFATARGVTEWSEEHPMCILGKWVHTLLMAAVDADAPEEPFFESEQQILDSPELGRDGIVFLADAQRQLQSDCSPHVGSMSADEYVAFIATISEAEDSGPFARLAPALQWSCMRTMARQLLALPRLRLLYGSDEDSSGPTSSPAEEKQRSSLNGSGGEGSA